MTYLQLVNAVLGKLREGTTLSVSSTPYSILIGSMVNDTKREVEDSWNWSMLRQTITITTTNGVWTYKLPGTNTRSRLRTVNNVTGRWPMREANQDQLTRWFTLAQPQRGSPIYFAKNGQVDATKEWYLDVFPIPNADGIVLKVNMDLPQNDLVNDGDLLQVPDHLVVLGAYHKALMERGDDEQAIQRAGLAYEQAVRTAISIDTEQFPGESDWQPV